MREVLDATVRRHRGLAAALAGMLAWLCAVAPAGAAGTIDKARESGKLLLGYSADSAPYAYSDSAGAPAGYAVTLCGRVAQSLKADLGLPSLTPTFVPLQRDDALRAVDQGKVDILCGASPSLERRAVVDFSVPIMLSGSSVAVRSDAPPRIMQALAGKVPSGATWRGSTDQAPARGVIAVIAGTNLEKALTDRLKERRIIVTVTPVKNAAEGVQLLAARNADAFFADHAVLLDAVAHSNSSADLKVLDTIYRRDIVAFAMRRNDDDFRLAVDRALSRIYRSKDIGSIYAASFGAPSQVVQDFFQLVALPD
jgi:ABC-type amino acid transport substrate-binding protein